MRRGLRVCLLLLAFAAQRAAYVTEMARAARDVAYLEGAATAFARNAAGATFAGCLAFVAAQIFVGAKSKHASVATALFALLLEGGAHVQRSSGQVVPASYVVAFAAGLFVPSAFAFAADILLEGAGHARAHVLAAFASVSLGVATLASVVAEANLGVLHRENSAALAGRIAWVGAAGLFVAMILSLRLAKPSEAAPVAGPYRRAAPTPEGPHADLDDATRVRAILPLIGAAAIVSLFAAPPTEGRASPRDLMLFSLLGVGIGAVLTAVLVLRHGKREPTTAPRRLVATGLAIAGAGGVLSTLGNGEPMAICIGVLVVALGAPASLAVSSAYVAARWDAPRRSVVIAVLFAMLAFVPVVSAVVVVVGAAISNAKIPVLLRLAETVVALALGVVLFVRKR